MSQEKKDSVTRRAPVTLSEHSHIDVERKIEPDISHTLSFRCLGNKVIPLNKGDSRNIQVSSNLIRSK